MTAIAYQALLAVTADGSMPFLGFDDKPFLGRGTTLHRAGGQLTLRGERAEDGLEDVYRLANIGETSDPDHGSWVWRYRHIDRARSLSVGDVVLATVIGTHTTRAFQVLPLGFAELDDELRGRITDLTSSLYWGDVASERARAAGRA